MKLLPPNNAAFVDDLTLWASDHCKEAALQRVQDAINVVAAWSDQNKMKLNVSKCELSFFASGSCDAKWEPTATLYGQAMPFSANPKFLGVHLDRTLYFTKQTEVVVNKVDKRCRLLSAIATKSWGWNKKNLGNVY